MSLYGTMRTGVSGMNAQANRLSTVGDNIANASTAGYKKASTQFSSLILPSSEGAYNSGGVTTNVRYSISSQGTFTYTTSSTDLAINGRGFFIVQGSDGIEYLTRAGNFTGMSDGSLQNAAGFTLMGYQYSSTEDPTIVVNGFDGLTEINLSSGTLNAAASQAGILDVNLPSKEPVGYVKTTSLVAYDSQGNTRLLDFKYTKMADNNWTVDVSYEGTSVMRRTIDPVVARTTNVTVTGNLEQGTTPLPKSGVVFDSNGTARTLRYEYTANGPTDWDVEVLEGSTSLGSIPLTFNALGEANDPSTLTTTGPLAGIEISFSGLKSSTDAEDVITSTVNGRSVATTAATVSGNLDATAATGTVVQTTGVAYDSTGAARTLRYDYLKTPTGWTMNVFEGMTSTIPLATSALTFDPVTGALTSSGSEVTTGGTLPDIVIDLDLTSRNGTSAVAATTEDGFAALPLVSFDANGQLISPASLRTEAVVVGGAVFNGLTIDISGSTQLSSDFKVGNGKIDGNAASDVVGHEISEDGIVYLKYSNGKLEPKYRIAMADVQSPDQLKPLAGNVYSQSNDSGVIVMGYAANGSYGTILSGALEDSNVDIAEELTSMIESQRNYTANSKVFQTGSELMEVLVNLKR